MKRCCSCKKNKKPSEFHVNASTRDGLSRTCKPCQLAYGRQHYKNNKQAYLKKASKNSKHARAAAYAMINAVKDVPCHDCKCKFPPYVMDLDHVRGKKLFAVSEGVSLGKGLSALKAEIEKCDVVCAVCHRIRTHERKNKSL